MAVEILDSKNFDGFIESGNVVIDFYADWCGPCKIMEPHFRKASEANKNIRFAKVDVDGNQKIAGRFQVMSIPTTIFFKDGEQVDRHTGAMSFKDIEETIRKNFD